jgi:hypothetical protein
LGGGDACLFGAAGELGHDDRGEDSEDDEHEEELDERETSAGEVLASGGVGGLYGESHGWEKGWGMTGAGKVT